jgi:hypothetical protein
MTLSDGVYTHHINVVDSTMGTNIFIAKGNEADPVVSSPLNQTFPVKSGYWIAKQSQVIVMAEVVNYKNTPQQVYLTLDYEYIPFPGGVRPSEYFNVNFAPVMTTDNAHMNLRMLSLNFIYAFTTARLTIPTLDPPKNRLVTYDSSSFPVFSRRDGYVINLGEFFTCNGS